MQRKPPSRILSRRRLIASLAAAAACPLAPRSLWPSFGAQAPPAREPFSTESQIRFEETAAKSGLHFTTRNCATPNKNQIETMVAGAALFDYDGDGFLDIYLVNGARSLRSRKHLRRTGIACSTTTATARSPT